MLNSDLLEVLLPILPEAKLFLPLLVKLGHHFVDAVLEAFLEREVVLIACLDDGLVMECVLDFDFCADLVLLYVAFNGLSGTAWPLLWAARSLGACWSSCLRRAWSGQPRLIRLLLFISVLETIYRAELLLEVDLEYARPESWELPGGALGHIFLAVHGDQMFDVLVLLFDNLVSRQHYELLFVDYAIEKLDKGACIVEVCREEFSRETLFKFEQLHLRIINQINVGCSSLLLLLVENLSVLLIGRVSKVRPEESQVLCLFLTVGHLEFVKFLVLCVHLVYYLCCISDSEVVVGTLGDFLAKILQSLSRSSELADHIDLEVLRLFLHMLKEDREVVWDFVTSFQVLHVLAGVQLLAQILAHLVDLINGFREADVWLLSILVANRTKDFQFFFDSFLI